MTPEPSTSGSDAAEGGYAAAFEAAYVREFGFTLRGRAIHVDDVRVRAMARGASVTKGAGQSEALAPGMCSLDVLCMR